MEKNSRFRYLLLYGIKAIPEISFDFERDGQTAVFWTRETVAERSLCMIVHVWVCTEELVHLALSVYSRRFATFARVQNTAFCLSPILRYEVDPVLYFIVNGNAETISIYFSLVNFFFGSSSEISSNL